MPTVLQLKTFLAVVDHGGFTSASRKLRLSQPAVSRAVASLEKELGLPLLHRQRDGVQLSEAGKRTARHAREALRHLDEMHAEVAAMRGGITGTIRLASLPFTTDVLVAPQLREFSQRHPGVEICVLEGSEPEIRDWLDQGAADAGVISLPARGLTTAFLAAQDMLAVVPAGHRLAARDEISYVELAREPFVRATGGCAQIYMAVANQVGVELDVAFEASGMSAVLAIVRSGMGVSILPAAALIGHPRGIAVRRLVPRTIRNLAVAVSASAGPAARAFLDQIAAMGHS
ncbi:LysR family transcriptional regulator [Mycobacterium kubicae]|uniref:LysR family transcriptional regulator n=1 Tax=Mycobacterium kubicae TaxID=120959 RepID=UPI0008024B5B|nr:LysR family transcriptional regulator [Mycobacterium kubicae]OBK47449.1 LysR family transcriptional regulator [Mycobacterium kubicae]QNI07299.1 LysR family transcriptional regulator [Mycobacterium kubicae]